ncbi:MAG: stage sporulation protein [Tepidanaerobacteraceae bacterium]|nr:stage sporulation protein [Tepidanaerobacteraceae bacterium]
MAVFRKLITIALAVALLSILGALAGASGIAGHGLDAGKNSGMDVEDLSSKIIRFHVVASGNSPKEQELKLRVRDAVLDALKDDLSKMEDIEETRNYIKSHLKNIEMIAKKEVEESGKDYEVKAFFGKFPFPVKTYGFITLPAGEYEALRIIIGKGGGKNWWCILFPPLCFVDITHGIATEEARLKLSEAFTPEDMSAAKNPLKGQKELEQRQSRDNTQDKRNEPAIEKRPQQEKRAFDNYQKSKNEPVLDDAKNLEEKPAQPNTRNGAAIVAVDKNPANEPVVVKFRMIEWLHAAWDSLRQNFKVALNN